MIRDRQITWLKEFLSGICVTEADRAEVEEIVDTFRKLWRVALAAAQNPYKQSPRLTEALDAIKEPDSRR